jgi:hypothetical protein
MRLPGNFALAFPGLEHYGSFGLDLGCAPEMRMAAATLFFPVRWTLAGVLALAASLKLSHIESSGGLLTRETALAVFELAMSLWLRSPRPPMWNLRP